MSKGLEALKEMRKYGAVMIPNCETIEKELKDYAEIKEIAKYYHWEDLANDVFKVETDRKWQLKFESAIRDVQEDYKKARAFEIIKEKGIILQFIKETYTVEQYNAAVEGTLVKKLTPEEYDLLKGVFADE